MSPSREGSNDDRRVTLVSGINDYMVEIMVSQVFSKE